MDVGAVPPADGRLEVLGQSRAALDRPEAVPGPVAHQGVQARVEEDGQDRQLDAGAPGGGGNGVAVDRLCVLVGQDVQKDLLDLGGPDQLRFDLVFGGRVCVCVVLCCVVLRCVYVLCVVSFGTGFTKRGKSIGNK